MFKAAGQTVEDDVVKLDPDFVLEQVAKAPTEFDVQARNPANSIHVGGDQMAFGVYEAAWQRGLRVPDDVSVVGFDDLPQARWSSPPLTTVRQQLVQMGMLAARTVLRLARGEEIDVERHALLCSTLTRLAQRIGIDRRAKNITPSLAEYLTPQEAAE